MSIPALGPELSVIPILLAIELAKLGFLTIDESDETTLVQKILQLAGIAIKDPGLYQLTDKEENETTQQEKL